jgi:hypothetical protein
MARSSTTYGPKWRSGKTCVIRVPEAIAEDVLEIARVLDRRIAAGRQKAHSSTVRKKRA